MQATIHELGAYLGASLAAIAGWFAINWVGRPILAVRSARLEAIRTAERYGRVSSGEAEESVNIVIRMLNDTVAKLRSLARAQEFYVHVYCLLMGYDLECAAKAVNGLAHLAGGYHADTQKNNLNLVYYSLNAYRHLSTSELTILKSALAEMA